MFRIWLNGLWFVIHDKALNFHNKICCYHEPFHDKVKRIKSMELSMDLWHLYNIKVIITLWTLSCWLCSFFLYWFFPYCSQSSQLILKNLIFKFLKIHDQTSINLTDMFHFIGNFWITLGLMKPNSFMALLNIIHINLQQCHNYVNELILATFSPFAIKCKKLEKTLEMFF